jgi:N4-gp56 family major capsid protein
MAVNGNTSGPMSATLFKQYWNEKFLTELRSKLQLADLGVKGTIPGGQGQIVHWLSMADMSLNTTAAEEGTDPTQYTLSGGDKQATLTPYNEAIKISRHLAKVWIQGSMDQVLDKLARNAKQKIDRVIRDTNLVASGLVNYTDGATTRATVAQSSTYAADIADFRVARADMERANVDPHTDGFFIAIAHPDVYKGHLPVVILVHKFLKLLEHLFLETISSQTLRGRFRDYNRNACFAG